MGEGWERPRGGAAPALPPGFNPPATPSTPPPPTAPSRLRHPADASVATYTGHSVLQTLIRARFAPAASAGGRYVYSGSACGRVFVWGELKDGVGRWLVRCRVWRRGLPAPTGGQRCAPRLPSPASRIMAMTPPSPPHMPQLQPQLPDLVTTELVHVLAYHREVVRDASWHPTVPGVLATASFDGSIVRWAPRGEAGAGPGVPGADQVEHAWW